MNGVKLAFGTIAALGIASIMTQRHGSRSSVRPIVFLDMDDTLLKAKFIGEDGIEGMIENARQLRKRRQSRITNPKFNDRMRRVIQKSMECVQREVTWLKAAKILSFDSLDEYAMVVRPGVVESLRELSKHADLYVFSNGTEDYIEACMNASPIGKIVKGWYSSRLWNHDLPEIEGRPWLLVDDLAFNTASVADKLRQILDIGEDDWRLYGPYHTDKQVPKQYEINHVQIPPFKMELPESEPFSDMAEIVLKRLYSVGFVGHRRRSGSLAKPSRDKSFELITKRRAHDLLRNSRVLASGEIEFETLPGLMESWDWSIIEGIIIDAHFVKVIVGDEDFPLGMLLWSTIKQAFVSTWVDEEVRGRGLGRKMVDLFRRYANRPVHFVGPYSSSGLRLAKHYSHEPSKVDAQRP